MRNIIPPFCVIHCVLLKVLLCGQHLIWKWCVDVYSNTSAQQPPLFKVADEMGCQNGGNWNQSISQALWKRYLRFPRAAKAQNTNTHKNLLILTYIVYTLPSPNLTLSQTHIKRSSHMKVRFIQGYTYIYEWRSSFFLSSTYHIKTAKPTINWLHQHVLSVS